MSLSIVLSAVSYSNMLNRLFGNSDTSTNSSIGKISYTDLKVFFYFVLLYMYISMSYLFSCHMNVLCYHFYNDCYKHVICHLIYLILTRPNKCCFMIFLTMDGSARNKLLYLIFHVLYLIYLYLYLFVHYL